MIHNLWPNLAVAELARWSLPIAEVCGLYQVNDKILPIELALIVEKTKIKKEKEESVMSILKSKDKFYHKFKHIFGKFHYLGPNIHK